MTDRLLEQSKEQTRFLRIHNIISSTTQGRVDADFNKLGNPQDLLKKKSKEVLANTRERIVDTADLALMTAQAEGRLLAPSITLTNTVHRTVNIYNDEFSANESYLINPDTIDKNAKIDYATIFMPQRFQFGPPTTPEKATSWMRIRPPVRLGPGSRNFALRSNFDTTSVAMSIHEDANGLVNHDNVAPSDLDDETYFPLSFTDLRIPTETIYFRAYIKSLSETLTPEVAVERYYGRMDPVPTYIGLTRAVNLTFDVVAYTENDLILMWKKINKLDSMTMPAYNSDLILTRGPIVRIRVGDLIADKFGNGLPCYISTLDKNYDETIWNLDKNLKAPRKVTISISVIILHEQRVEVNGGGEPTNRVDQPALIANQNNDKFNLKTTFFRKIGQIETEEIAPITNSSEDLSSPTLLNPDFSFV